ncbi:ribonuclease H-like domain-containing protein [Tanacetum coccineum]
MIYWFQEKMELVSAQVVAAAKLPLLNPGEFELRKIRIKQYFLMTDYALWEVILNGDSPLLTRTVDGIETSVPPTTTEQKLARKNELKSRGTLLMALPNEHQLNFNTYKSVKTFMEAIEKRFGGNKESKKVQKTLLKQQYENFNGKGSEGLDQIYDRLQKLISQLEIHRETISQEDVNLKLLRNLSSEWKTHTLIWRNKPNLEDLSMDDLYNNLKIYEDEIIESSSTNQNTQNIAFVSSNITSSTNKAVKTAHGVSAANSKNNAYTLPNVDSLSDVVIYSFFASQSNNSQLDNEDVKQINPDDSEEIDLKWQMAMLTIRARRFLKKIGRNIGVNGTDTIGFNKTKVECYNCHRRGHFARECRAPKNQDSRNKETTKRTVPVKETTSNDLVSQCDGFGYDWSDQAEEGPTNFALMAYTSSSSSSSDTKSLEKFEKAKKERDDLKLILEKFKNSSKNLSKLLDSQICDKFKSGVGYDSQVFDSQVFDSQVNDKYKTGEEYHAVPPPYIGNFMPPKPDLVLAEKDEYVFSKSATSVPSTATGEVKTSVSKPKSHVKSPRESVKKVENNKQAKYLRKNSQSSRDCDFYEKKMVEKPVWNNARAVLMKSGFKTLNTARQKLFEVAGINTVRENVTTVGTKAVVSDNKGNEANVVKASAYWVWRPKQKVLDYGNPQLELKEKGVIDSGCSRHMIGNKSYLSDYEEIDGGFVAFGGNSKGGKITRKGKIRTGKLDFKDVYFVKELKFNLFSVSQMCDKKNSVLFTDTECVVLSSDFKLTDENHVLLKVPRKDNMYSVDLRNVVPQGGLTCLFAKATLDESNLWHRRSFIPNEERIGKSKVGLNNDA